MVQVLQILSKKIENKRKKLANLGASFATFKKKRKTNIKGCWSFLKRRRVINYNKKQKKLRTELLPSDLS